MTRIRMRRARRLILSLCFFSSLSSSSAGQVCTTIDSLNLGQYTAPVIAQVERHVLPQVNAGIAYMTPIVTPYVAKVEPYLGDAKPFLEKVSQQETLYILAVIFGGAFFLQLLLLLTSVCRRGSSGLKSFSPTVFWCLMCFTVHSWIEYHFVFHRNNNQSGFQNGMDLYGAADYRYGFGENLELEPGTAAMEAITALVSGPLCLFLAWAIVGNKPYRWTLQLITCVCQLYGLGWFVAHTLFSPEQVASNDPFLFWVLYVGFNAPWSIFPTILLIQAVCKVNGAMSKVQKIEAAEAKAAKSALQAKKNK